MSDPVLRLCRNLWLATTAPLRAFKAASSPFGLSPLKDVPGRVHDRGHAHSIRLRDHGASPDR